MRTAGRSSSPGPSQLWQAYLGADGADHPKLPEDQKHCFAEGPDEGRLRVFLADLYQYDLGKPELARKALAGYLKLADNSDVRKRLQELKGASE